MPIASPRPAPIAIASQPATASPGASQLSTSYGVGFYGLNTYGIAASTTMATAGAGGPVAVPNSSSPALYGVSSYGQNPYGTIPISAPMATPVSQ